jgi:HAMP domain-containing protein
MTREQMVESLAKQLNASAEEVEYGISRLRPIHQEVIHYRYRLHTPDAGLAVIEEVAQRMGIKRRSKAVGLDRGAHHYIKRWIERRRKGIDP